ncbi:hypothetical protein ACFVMC_32800 [Nocardia sp. NPDC127579]|uniref:hypothetical protein n=1 Tax=Nocardia sp. NPDC127579 TaxID=3345402 RepID=UPI003639F46D
MRIRERVIPIPVVLSGGGGGVLGGVGVMAGLFGFVVFTALLALVLVVRAYPQTEYSTVPSTTRTPGPCAPFCIARSTTTPAPQGGELR